MLCKQLILVVAGEHRCADDSIEIAIGLDEEIEVDIEALLNGAVALINYIRQEVAGQLVGEEKRLVEVVYGYREFRAVVISLGQTIVYKLPLIFKRQAVFCDRGGVGAAVLTFSRFGLGRAGIR